jgi:acyl-CoA synthetase (AMP-forming)/AMP-acid ligase II
MCSECPPTSFNLAKHCLAKSASENAGKTALVFLSELEVPEIKLSYGEIECSALKFCAHLQAKGLQKGDRIFIKLNTSPQFVTSFFGAIAGGFVPVALSSQLTSQEVMKYISIAPPQNAHS